MRYIWSLACLFIFMLGSAVALNEEERLQFADGLLARGLTDLALKEYASFLKDYPASRKSDAAHFRMGEAYSRQKQTADAFREFKLVHDGYPESEYRLKAGYKIGDLAMESGEYKSAIAMFNVLMNENPPDDLASSTLYSLGEANLKTGNTNDAIKAYVQLRTKYPKSEFFSYAVLQLGKIYSANPGKADEVLRLYELAAKNPANDRIAAEALFQIAEYHFAAKTFDRSAAAYQRLISSYPKDFRAAEARLQAGWANHNAGMYAEALVYAAEGLKTGTGEQRAEWLYLKANCERQLLKSAEALKTYGELVKTYPASQFVKSANYEIALTHYKEGRYGEAVTAASRVRDGGELMKDVYWLLAESHSMLKEDGIAIQYYKLLAREFPKSEVSCDATYRVGHSLQAKGQYKEAGRYFSAVVENFPSNSLAAKALFASAFCMTKDGLYAEAARDWALLIQKYPSDPLVEDSLYQKAVSEMKLTRDANAAGSFKELIKKYPDSRFGADAHYWLGVLLLQDKKSQEAEEEFRQALKMKLPRDLEREVRFGLALALQKTGKLDESAKLLQDLLATPAKDKFNPALLEWLAEYRLAGREYAQVLEAAKQLQETGKDLSWQQIALGLQGKAYMAQGEKVKAAAVFKSAMDLKVVTRFAPESALSLGDLMLGTTNIEAAAKYFEQAARLAADDAYAGVRAKAYAGMGRTARARGEFEAAAKYFMSVAILYDDAVLVPECLYEAADCFAKCGRAEAAEKTAGELRTRFPDSEWAKRYGAAAPGVKDQKL